LPTGDVIINNCNVTLKGGEVIINPNTCVNLGATLEAKIEKNESSNTLIMYLCIGIITKDYLI
jgi:hypothetical protein